MFVAGKQVLVSRHVMEQTIGRKLQSSEIVHHIDGNPFNNDPDNLQLTNRSDHKKMHPEIGQSTRLQKVWRIDPLEVRQMLNGRTLSQIAGHFGCSEATIRRSLKSLSEFQFDLRSIRRRLCEKRSKSHKENFHV